MTGAHSKSFSSQIVWISDFTDVHPVQAHAEGQVLSILLGIFFFCHCVGITWMWLSQFPWYLSASGSANGKWKYQQDSPTRSESEAKAYTQCLQIHAHGMWAQCCWAWHLSGAVRILTVSLIS